MRTNDHKAKQPTKSEFINEIIPKKFKEELQSAHIKGLVQGFELANNMLLEYAKGKTIEEVVEFCKKNVDTKVMEKMVGGKKQTDG